MTAAHQVRVLLLLVLTLVAPVAFGDRRDRHQDESPQARTHDHHPDEEHEVDGQEVRDESEPDDEIEDHRRQGQGKDHGPPDGDEEDGDVASFHDLEPSMLRNRSSAHHDMKDRLYDFNPVEGIELPSMTYRDLFHAIDTDEDGRLTVDELAAWIAKLVATTEAHSAAEQWNEHEKANPNAMTWEEFESIFGRDSAAERDGVDGNTKVDEDHMRFIQRRWKHCDANKDGALNFAEFIDFQYPEDRHHLQDLRFQEHMERLDTNKDGKVSLSEFLIDMHSLDSPLGHFLESSELDLDHFDDEQLVTFPNGTRVSSELLTEVKLFMNTMDGDGDKFLNMAEARVLILPPEYAIPEQAEAQNLIRQFQPRSRKNKKKVTAITLDMFLEKRNVFAQSLATNYGQIIVDHEALQHDEL